MLLECIRNGSLSIDDVGVAGIHRLFDKLHSIRKAKVVIVVNIDNGFGAGYIASMINKI